MEEQHEGKKPLWLVKSHHVRTCVCDRTTGASKMVQVKISEQGGVVSEHWYLQKCERFSDGMASSLQRAFAGTSATYLIPSSVCSEPLVSGSSPPQCRCICTAA